MENNLVFFKSTNLVASTGNPGLLDLFFAHLHELRPANVLQNNTVIIPNHALGSWLKDELTLRDGICANLKLEVLPGSVFEQIYRQNNPLAQLFDFNQSKYIIYDYLLAQQIATDDAHDLNNYIFHDGSLDKLRVYDLAVQLQQIFHEYLYLRTEDLLKLPNCKLPKWQQQILMHLLATIGEKKTFLDIYTYFTSLTASTTLCKLPERLYIFGLTSIYPSQLKIILKLSEQIPVYWYYLACTSEYYGDLLSNKAKASLEKKLLRKPELNLDDLYLIDGNPLLANLGQQSREFVELLNAHEIEVFNLSHQVDDSAISLSPPLTMLATLQDDIRHLRYRIAPQYRLQAANIFYADPLELPASDAGAIYDLPEKTSSIKINICHNKMREVQVLFNEIATLLNSNPQLRLDEILVTAPNINVYAAYLGAVFDNEEMATSDGCKLKLPYSLANYTRANQYKILETLKLLLNLPPELPVSYFLELLLQAEIQAGLDLTPGDIELVRQWLFDNKVNFGVDANDYQPYGYHEYNVHHFKAWLTNLVLGACLNEEILASNFGVPIYLQHNKIAVPYDNLDSGQIELCGKLINFIDLLVKIRTFFYVNKDTWVEFNSTSLHDFLLEIQKQLFVTNDWLLTLNQFIGSLLQLNLTNPINLPILNQMLDEYITQPSFRVRFEGKINCASMHEIRNIPYQVIYIMGMNLGEFPRSYRPNQLSILAHDWFIADRNYNIEDKQVFLDIILGAKKQLVISYVGRKETDNKEIKPAAVLSLLLNTLGQSFSNFQVADVDGFKHHYDFKNVVFLHSLHPFYNNQATNYSEFWHNLALITGESITSLRWDFSKPSLIKLDLAENYLPVKDLVATFCYTNRNLYKTLGISTYAPTLILQDEPGFSVLDRNIAKALLPLFKQYANQVNPGSLQQYLQAKGILAYAHIGELQFGYYHNLYLLYQREILKTTGKLEFNYSFTHDDGREVTYCLTEEVTVDKDMLIVGIAWERITDKALPADLTAVDYTLKIKAIIFSLLIQSGALIDGRPAMVQGVVIRLMKNDGTLRDFKIRVDTDKVDIHFVFKYYLRSLVNPVLIHKGAISQYAKTLNTVRGLARGAKNSYAQEATAAAKSVYLSKFANYELDAILTDVIFAPIAEDYFRYMDEMGGVNDIIKIGTLLSFISA